MMQNINRLINRRWQLALLLLVLLPLLGGLHSRAAVAEGCPKCGQKLTVTVYSPTCSVEGYEEYRCNECNNYHEIVPIPKADHKWKVKSETPATCLDSAQTTYRCSECSLEEVKQVSGSKPLGHDYSETVVPPTCSEDGYTLHTCSRCKDSYQTNEIKKIDHTFSQEIIQAPTCETIGYCRNICTICAYFETVEMPLAEHSWIAQVVDPTHTEKGYTSYTCQVCAVGHRDDYTDYKPYNMIWTIQEATCTESGFRVGVCEDGCGHTETVIISPNGHEFGEWEVIRRAEAHAAGLESRTCTHCQYAETRSIPFVPVEKEEEEPKQITPMMILIVAFLLIVTLGIMILVLLLLLENSGRGRKKFHNDAEHIEEANE